MTSDIHIIYPSWSDSKHPTVTIAAKLLHLLQKTQPMPAARKVPYKVCFGKEVEITKKYHNHDVYKQTNIEYNISLKGSDLNERTGAACFTGGTE